MDKRIKLKVLGITYSQIQSGAYALVLAEQEGSRRIPIIIGTSEAQSIAIQLEHLTPPRPLTHDLFISFAKLFEIKLKEVFIYKFEDGVFSSELFFEDAQGNEKKLDSRTSDAIAFALRCDAQISTTEEILSKAGVEFEDSSGVLPNENSGGIKTDEQKMEELNDRLKIAVEQENYEEASRIRDEIQKLKEEQTTGSDSSQTLPN